MSEDQSNCLSFLQGLPGKPGFPGPPGLPVRCGPPSENIRTVYKDFQDSHRLYSKIIDIVPFCSIQQRLNNLLINIFCTDQNGSSSVFASHIEFCDFKLVFHLTAVVQTFRKPQLILCTFPQGLPGHEGPIGQPGFPGCNGTKVETIIIFY